jgi:multiple sugar transport system ATP-binding protein
LPDGIALPLPAAIAARKDLNSDIMIGFRAEALAPKGHGLPGMGEKVELDRLVTLAEPLGTETLLFTDLGGREVQGRMLDPRSVAPGERLPFVLDLSRLHVFAKTDGRSLRV